jgi:CheY-like chemotaxis protein
MRQDDEPIALVDLGKTLGGVPAQPTAGEAAPAILIRAGGRALAVWVDEVEGVQEVPIRALGPLLRHHRVFTGTGRLDDGRHALMLDVAALFRASSRASAPAPMAAAPVARPATGPATVLVVDDSEVVRDLMHGFLVSEGLHVVEAVNGQDALALMQAEAPDLVITDLQMPVMDGFGLLSSIREHPEWLDIPVVVCSTLDATADKMRASALGADAYIVKSELERDMLLAQVKRFVARKSP